MEAEVATLAEQFASLVEQGLIRPSADAPRFEALYRTPRQRSRVVYNVGEVLIREERARAKLGPGSQRD